MAFLPNLAGIDPSSSLMKLIGYVIDAQNRFGPRTGGAGGTEGARGYPGGANPIQPGVDPADLERLQNARSDTKGRINDILSEVEQNRDNPSLLPQYFKARHADAMDLYSRLENLDNMEKSMRQEGWQNTGETYNALRTATDAEKYQAATEAQKFRNMSPLEQIFTAAKEAITRNQATPGTGSTNPGHLGWRGEMLTGDTSGQSSFGLPDIEFRDMLEKSRYGRVLTTFERMNQPKPTMQPEQFPMTEADKYRTAVDKQRGYSGIYDQPSSSGSQDFTNAGDFAKMVQGGMPYQVHGTFFSDAATMPKPLSQNGQWVQSLGKPLLTEKGEPSSMVPRWVWAGEVPE